MPDSLAVGGAQTRTTCPYCGVGCGLIAMKIGDDVSISGDPDHPANFGRLCSKGAALGETLSLEGRLLYPTVGGKRVSWDAALEQVAAKILSVRAEYGPGAIAFYLSGQLLTEDYYVANKLAKGFLGTSNVDTNSRLCMASSVAGHKRAFGEDVVPQNYQDLDEADLIVLTGSNAAWCHPVLFQRIQQNRESRGAQVVVIDPRETATAEGADLHLGINPGQDSALFNGLLVWLVDNNACNDRWVDRHTEGFDSAVAAARQMSGTISQIAMQTGLSKADILKFYNLFARTGKTVTCYSQGVNQSVAGTDKVNAILNCHLATGRISRAGCGPLSLTGQPNAMGGRETGGLANQLAAHMDFVPADIDRVRRFWNAPDIVTEPGLKAVDMFEAVAAGEIKFLWVMATNPAVSLPDSDRANDALNRIETLVVSDNVDATDTLDHALIKLPAAAWGERDGTVTNSERRISRQRRFLTPPGDARPDWWIVTQVARRLGYGDAFPYEHPAEIFAEHAALSTFENDGGRVFDIGAFAKIDEPAYDRLVPTQWPIKDADIGAGHVFDAGRFPTRSGKAQFVSVCTSPIADTSGKYPFVLNTGRVRDQWHTMSRTGKSATLGRHIYEPYIEIHPEDARRFGLEHGTLAEVTTANGAAILRVVLTSAVLPGTLFAPIHWSAQTASHGRVGSLAHALRDPFSGQPDLKQTPATIAPYDPSVTGFFISTKEMNTGSASWWSRSRIDGGYGYTLALNTWPHDAKPGVLRDLFVSLIPGAGEPDRDLIELADPTSGTYRAAVIVDDRVAACGYLASNGDLPSAEWLRGQLGKPVRDRTMRKSLLMGDAIEGGGETGPVVCACFAVGLNAITKSIRDGGAADVADIGRVLGAGTNCGSCVPELRRLLKTERVYEPAEI